MKAFTERNPRTIGVVVIAAIALTVLAVVFLNRSLFRSGYEVEARFSSAGGIGKGTTVLLAGVPVGTVDSVELAGNDVDAVMTINEGIVLPQNTSAAIEVETLLGVVDVTLDPVSGWSKPLRNGAVIEDTSVPTEFYQLSDTAGKLLQHADTKAFDSLVKSLSTITAGKQQQVAEIIKGLGALTTTVDERSGEVSQLIDSANVLSTALATRDQQLASVIDNLTVVSSGLAAHSSDLADLVDNVDAMASQTNGLLGEDRPQLNSLLQNLTTTLGVVGQHQDDLAEVVSYLASALKGFASVAYGGTTPTPWANIYANALGITSTAGVLSPCGTLDQALDEVLGPTPLACTQQTGPLPGTTATTPPATGPTAGTAHAAETTGGGRAAAATTTPTTTLPGVALPAGPDSGVAGLSQLLGPLAGGGT